MSYIIGGIKAFFFGFVFIFSFIARLVVGVLYAFFYTFAVIFGTLRKFTPFIVPLVYLYFIFIHGSSPFNFNGIKSHAAYVYQQICNDNKIVLVYGGVIVSAILTYAISKFLFKPFDMIYVKFGLANYEMVRFNDTMIKKVRTGIKQAKYGTGINADYAIIKDYKTTLNYYKNILLREGMSKEEIDSYKNASYFESVYDKGIEMHYFIDE